MNNTQKHLAALFKPGEETYFGFNDGQHFQEWGSGPIQNVTAVDADYVCLNPLNGKKLDSNVTAYRTWLLEFDTIPLQQQLDLLSSLEKFISIRSITYSGSKSYHALISLSDDIGFPIGPKGIEGYSNLFTALVDAAETVLNCPGAVDRSNKNCSRYTRLAGGFNHVTKAPQPLIREGALTTSTQLMDFIVTHRAAVTKLPLLPNISLKPVYSLSFERTLATQSHLKGLRHKLLLPRYWAQKAGNRRHIFNAALWAIDATGVQYEEFLQYANQHISPVLEEVGYENARQKVEAAIKGAYRWKNLK